MGEVFSPFLSVGLFQRVHLSLRVRSIRSSPNFQGTTATTSRTTCENILEKKLKGKKLLDFENFRKISKKSQNPSALGFPSSSLDRGGCLDEGAAPGSSGIDRLDEAARSTTRA